MNEKLLIFNKEGFIPGPNESEENYFLRVKNCLNLKKTLREIEELEPLKIETLITTGHFSLEALKKTTSLFDLSPSWIPLVFSEYGLSYWQGGCSWIFEEETTAGFFQLKPVFKNKKGYLFFYERDEVIAHEIVHVCRMMFDEEKFEELIAYRTSPSSFRRFFGTLVQSSKESLSFLVFLFLGLISNFLFIAFNLEFFLQLSIFLNFISVSFFGFAVLRLVKKQHTFKKALKNLKALARGGVSLDAILVRLKDQEIELFSKSSSHDILDYVEREKKSSLRWQVLSTYFRSPFI